MIRERAHSASVNHEWQSEMDLQPMAECCQLFDLTGCHGQPQLHGCVQEDRVLSKTVSVLADEVSRDATTNKSDLRCKEISSNSLVELRDSWAVMGRRLNQAAHV
jgi:hypothetical protein